MLIVIVPAHVMAVSTAGKPHQHALQIAWVRHLYFAQVRHYYFAPTPRKMTISFMSTSWLFLSRVTFPLARYEQDLIHRSGGDQVEAKNS
jgi:hypothetical protein